MATTTGLKSLQAKLGKLPAQTKSRVRQAMAQGADEMVETMRNLAPELKQAKKGRQKGALKNSIVATFGDGNVPAYAAFRQRGKGRARTKAPLTGQDPSLSVIITAGNNVVRYAHLVEFGTAPHINGGKFAGTRNPGMRAQPFFYPGYRANRKQFKSKVSRAITKAIKEIAASD